MSRVWRNGLLDCSAVKFRPSHLQRCPASSPDTPSPRGQACGHLPALLVVCSLTLSMLTSLPTQARPAHPDPTGMTPSGALPTLDGWPRPSEPPLERGPVLPEHVERWRKDAKAMEYGEPGFARDPVRAAELYCRAARHGDAESQFSLAWMLTNSRGIERDEAQAAHLFAAAAEQGYVQAANILARMGPPRGDLPACLRSPDEDKALLAAAAAAAAATALSRSAAADSTPVGGGRNDPAGGSLRGSARSAPVTAESGAQSAAQSGVRSGARSGARSDHQSGTQFSTQFGNLASPPPPPRGAPEALVRFVRLLAPQYQLEPHLVLAFIATESNFDAQAVSPKNAQGLMQLIPGTAARFGVRKIMDPTENVRGGMAYLRWLMARFQGDVVLVAAAYNAGEGAVERYLGVPPYAETRQYVWKIVSGSGGMLNHGFDPSVTAVSDQMPLMRRPWKPR